MTAIGSRSLNWIDMIRDEIKNIKSTKKDLRSFGLVVGGVLAAIGGLLLWFDKPANVYFLSIGAILMLSGLIVPVILKPLQKAWMVMAVLLGWVMTRVILTILYYVVFTAIGILGRIFGKQFLEVKWDAGQESYWNYRSREPVTDKTVYEKQF